MKPIIKALYLEGADRKIGLPAYETPGSAGADIRANLQAEDREKGILLAPGERALIPTGLQISIPDGYEVQVRPRSGLALKHGITLANAPGTIDRDYRGPLGVILINLGAAAFQVAHGDRIAQLVVAPVVRAGFQLAPVLDDTARGAGGFGSTGRS